MKPLGCYSNQQLLQMLGEALHKEIDGWNPKIYQPVSDMDDGIGGSQRDAMVRQLLDLNDHFNFYPETFFLATSIVDRFLSIVKARQKHLKIISVTCFYLAAKVMEEDEVIPGTLELVRASECGCSVAEILRMERCILSKLGWDLRTVTPLHLLHIFHALLLSNVPHLLDACGHMTPSRQLSLLTAKLEQVMCHHDVCTIPPSSLALAILSLELELFCPNWLTITFMLQKTVQLDNAELIRCRETIAQYFSHNGRGCAGRYVYQSKSPSPPSSSTTVKRRRVQENPHNPSDDEEDNIYEGIKQLYEEDKVGLVSCGAEVRQDQSSAVLLRTLVI